MKALGARSVFGTPTLKQLTPSKARPERVSALTEVAGRNEITMPEDSAIVGKGVVGRMVIE